MVTREHSRKLGSAFSARTKDALAAARARGVRLGNRTNLGEAQRLAAAARKAEAARRAPNVLPIVEEARRQGPTSLHKIATALNARKVSIARGGEWDAK